MAVDLTELKKTLGLDLLNSAISELNNAIAAAKATNTEAKDIRLQVTAALSSVGLAHRWTGTRLDLKTLAGDWVEGPDLRGDVGPTIELMSDDIGVSWRPVGTNDWIKLANWDDVLGPYLVTVQGASKAATDARDEILAYKKRIVTQTGNFTLSDNEMNALVVIDSATDVTITIPPSLAPGFDTEFMQRGDGIVTFTGDMGVTLLSLGDKFRTAGKNAVCHFTVIEATDTTALTGVLSRDLQV